MYNQKTVVNNLINWIQKEFSNRHAENAIIGISGGKDSLVCAMLTELALGKQHVYGVLMPNGKQADINDSYKICQLLGIEYTTINIGPAYDALTKEFGITNYVYNTNTPARLRMTTQ